MQLRQVKSRREYRGHRARWLERHRWITRELVIFRDQCVDGGDNLAKRQVVVICFKACVSPSRRNTNDEEFTEERERRERSLSRNTSHLSSSSTLYMIPVLYWGIDAILRPVADWCMIFALMYMMFWWKTTKACLRQTVTGQCSRRMTETPGGKGTQSLQMVQRCPSRDVSGPSMIPNCSLRPVLGSCFCNAR